MSTPLCPMMRNPMGQNKDCVEDTCAWWNKDAKICAITAMSYAMNLQTASLFVGQKDKFLGAVQQTLKQQQESIQDYSPARAVPCKEKKGKK